MSLPQALGLADGGSLTRAMALGMTGFTQEDLCEIYARGLTPDVLERQIELLRHPPRPVRLARPCTLGDGILRLSEQQKDAALAAYEEARGQGRLLKMVPASGAATRMFQCLLRARAEWPSLQRAEVAKWAASNADARATLAFMDGLERFAFFDELHDAMARNGLDLHVLAARGDFQPILDHLFTRRGLGYGLLPKVLLSFHKHSRSARTPLEEHLVEAADYVRDAHGVCRLHFTVSAEHRDSFVERLRAVQSGNETRLGVRYEVGVSIQHPSTDTIALDEDNELFRTREGRILFRPGGHGSLIGNLDDLHGDLVHLCNVDNVVPDRLKPQVIYWRRILAGHLCVLQARAHDCLRRLVEAPHEAIVIETSARFVVEDLGIDLPPHFATADAASKRKLLMEFLDRPMRVCGMILNKKEPGGGPFWVYAPDGTISRQIVESAEVDHEDKEQREILQSATHFNPVDMVCGLRDWRGCCFSLRKYVHPNAVFISEKSHEGRRLKALEHPGLWNGAMGNWITVFVEIPRHVFNPVKTCLDLLRPEHQPA